VKIPESTHSGTCSGRIIELYNSGGHSAHRVCTDHNPTQAPSPFTRASPPDTNGQISMANPAHPHIFGLWEETGAPGGNPHGRLCKLHTDGEPRPELNLGPWRCEAAVLTSVPLCRPPLGWPESLAKRWHYRNTVRGLKWRGNCCKVCKILRYQRVCDLVHITQLLAS